MNWVNVYEIENNKQDRMGEPFPKFAILSGIEYVIQEHEGLLVFTESCPMDGARNRIYLEKTSMIWYLTNVECSSVFNHLPVCHIEDAMTIATAYRGGDHSEADCQAGALA